jgi:hypothetical protein
VEVQLYSFLISVVDWDEWLASCPNRLPPEKEHPLLTEPEVGWAGISGVEKILLSQLGFKSWIIHPLLQQLY